MKDRCELHTNDNYAFYGGRGIRVCVEWSSSFISFREWSLKSGYSDGLSIDRIDVNGNYGPENCKWATKTEQANNKREPSNVCFIDHNGERKTLRQWSVDAGIGYTTLRKRFSLGLRGDALFAPVDKRKSHPSA